MVVTANAGNHSAKKILLVLPEVFGCAGGIQMFCRALCLAAGRWAQRNKASLSAIVLNDECAPDPRYVNGGFSSYGGAGKSKTRFVSNYVQQIIRYQPDLIVVGHISLAPLTMLPVMPRRQVKSFVITYGLDVWRPLSLLERRAIQKATAVLAISDYTKSELVKRNAIDQDKIRIFPCSLDPFWVSDSQPAAAASAPPIILTVGRMEKEDAYKGVDSVIRSLPTVVREVGPVDYRIVGRGDDIPRLKALAENLEVSQYVTFTGSLSDEELREQYRRCTLFVMPSEYEGFGIVFLEAMAYTKPVIGGAHRGTLSVIRDEETGLLVNRLDIDGLSRAISRILRDDELRLRLGRAGRQDLLERFTFERFEANLNELFRSCL